MRESQEKLLDLGGRDDQSGHVEFEFPSGKMELWARDLEDRSRLAQDWKRRWVMPLLQSVGVLEENRGIRCRGALIISVE